MLRQYSVDAAVVASSTLPPEFSSAFSDAGLPVVHAFARHSRRPDVNTVGIDNMECGRLAAREFHARGYRKVAFLGGPSSATSSIDRHAGFAEVVGSFASMTMSASFSSDYSFQAGRTEMLRLLDNDPAEAYFCGDDVLSIGAMSALNERGHHVPCDVGILGINDIEMAGWPNINLTTIRQPVSQIVDAVVARIGELLLTPDCAPKAVVFDAALIERGTLRPRA